MMELINISWMFAIAVCITIVFTLLFVFIISFIWILIEELIYYVIQKIYD